MKGRASFVAPIQDRGGRARFAGRAADARNIGTGPTVRALVEASFASEIRFASSRRATEDRAAVFEVAGALVVVVADGAGGIAGGAVASDALVSAVRQRSLEPAFDPWSRGGWCDLLERVDRELVLSREGGETTALVLVVGACGVLGVGSGDSETWSVDEEHVDRLTEGLDRARLGHGRARPTSFHRGATAGTLLVATDGLFKHASERAIVACVRGSSPLGATADALVELPRMRTGIYPDDVALAIVRRAALGTVP